MARAKLTDINHLPIGIDADLTVYDGYDTMYCIEGHEYGCFDTLSVEEALAVADMAIERWQRLKTKLLGQTVE